MQHLAGGVVGNRDQGGPVVRQERQPGMRAAVKMQELAKARAWLPPTPMPASGSMLLDQTRRLQRLFQKAIRHRDPMLSASNLMEVSAIETGVPLAIEPEQALDHRSRHPPNRRAMQPLVDQTDIAVL